MRYCFFVTLVVCFLVPAASQDKGWRGIEPLISTRADVERRLGRCPQDNPDSCLYKNENEMIMVQYADGPCERDWPFGYNVTKGTVIGVEVSPLNYLHITALGLNLDDYERKVNKDGSRTLVNNRQGITVQEFDGKVGSVFYGPTVMQQHLHCGGSSKTSVGKSAVIADPHNRLYKYGDISPAEEIEILNYFANLLRREPNTQGYIIVYAGQNSFEREAARRLECQTNYLTKRQGINTAQLTTINGGYREDREVELYVLPKDGPSLLPYPTVRPSLVKIIDEKTSPTNLFSLCSSMPAN